MTAMNSTSAWLICTTVHMLLRMIQHPNITIHRATIPVSFEKGMVQAACGSETLLIPADSLVFAGRMFPVNAVAQALQGSLSRFCSW